MKALARWVRKYWRRALNRIADALARRGLSFERIPAQEAILLRTREATTRLPDGAAAILRRDNPRLLELKKAYAAMPARITTHSRWIESRLQSVIPLQYFRGDTHYVWNYRERSRITELKYYALLQHVRSRDSMKLLDRLDEDGEFGCWTYDFGPHGRVSRDLLESILEINYLERNLGLSRMRPLRVLDIGAGYGRLAHRMTQAVDNIEDYCCVDAIPESTFLSEYYLDFRGISPPARVVPLHEVGDKLTPGSFDLALNIHSFSECTFDAVSWWVEQLSRLEIRRLLVVPNHPDRLLTLETDGSRRDFLPLLEAVGYELAHREAVVDDGIVRRLMSVPEDHFHLFERK